MLKVALLDTRASAELPASSQQALLPQQLSYYQGLRSAKRRKEYLFSRLLLNRQLRTYLPHVQLSNVYQETITGPKLDNTDYFISLSHSHGVIVTVLSNVVLGVDVEYMKQRTNLLELARLFMNARELEGFVQMPLALQQKAFYRAWTTKEAIYKSLPTTLQKEKVLSDLVYGSPIHGTKAVVREVLRGTFMLAVAMGE